MMRYKLGEIFNLQMGKTPDRHSPKFWNEGTEPWISIADLTKCNKYIENTAEKITATAVDGSGIKIIPKNTVIMSFKLSIGKVAITSKEMYSNEAIMSFIDKGVLKIEPVYLYYLLMHKDWDTGTNKAVMGKTLNKASLSQMTVNIHGYSEQLEIIKALDAASSIIAARKQQLAELDKLIKARFVEMFGDPKINPNNYPVCQLSDFIVFLTSGSRGWAQYCADDGTEWFITIKNVKDCHIETDNMQPINAPDNAEAKRTRVQEGDLLISITADLGRTGVVTKEITEHGAYINQHLTCIRLKQDVLNPLYVAYFMESPAGKEQFESKNQSAVKAGLNFNSINSLRLMVPPLDDQNAFVDFIKQTDKSKVAIQKALDEAQLLFDSLMQKYFE